MSLKAGRASLQILLLMFIDPTLSGTLKLTPDPGTTINISSSQAKDCKVCTGSGDRQCYTSLELLNKRTPISLEFNCSRPQDVFRVEIVRNIGCNTKSCNGNIIQNNNGPLSLLSFNRTFTWTVKGVASKAFKIDFTKTGLQQIKPSEKCPDGQIYTLQALESTGNVVVGKYCRTGHIGSAQILNQGSFSVDVPAGQKLQNGPFVVSVGEEIKSLAKMSLTLPKGTSSFELLSPNYPESFPDGDRIEWHFQVPEKHRTAVQFLDLTKPSCAKEIGVEYHKNGRKQSVLSLTDIQPPQNRGQFSLTLTNCKMGRSAASPGFSFILKVSTSNAGPPVSCNVKLNTLLGLSLHINKLSQSSDCVMKMNSVKKENIMVTSSADLYFQDCYPEDIQVLATQVIDSTHLKSSSTSFHLSVPELPSCLPTPLSRMKWTLRPARHGTVKLTSPNGPLKQSLPGQLCNDSNTIEMAEEEGTNIGTFCPNGTIQQVHIHTNVSVTWWSSMDTKALIAYNKHLMEASFEKGIPERYIFTLSLKKDTPVFVATPGWPEGMRPHSGVSWIVSVPSKMEAHLMFANISQPKCIEGHTNIKVQRQGSPEEDYSRREDEMAESELTVSKDFYLNMSNCKPEAGLFRVLTKITLQKSKSLLLTIILSVVSALLIIFIIVLVVVCVAVRKKKKQLSHEVAIYNPNGTSFLPGNNDFSKTCEDDSHVYTTIDDSLIYTHLLKNGAEMGIYEEIYQPFAGQTDSQKPLVSKHTGDDNMEIGVYQSQLPPVLPKRPLSQLQTIVDQSEDEQSPNLGPQVEPEEGN